MNQTLKMKKQIQLSSSGQIKQKKLEVEESKFNIWCICPCYEMSLKCKCLSSFQKSLVSFWLVLVLFWWVILFFYIYLILSTIYLICLSILSFFCTINVWFMSYVKCWSCRRTWNLCFLFNFHLKKIRSKICNTNHSYWTLKLYLFWIKAS